MPSPPSTPDAQIGCPEPRPHSPTKLLSSASSSTSCSLLCPHPPSLQMTVRRGGEELRCYRYPTEMLKFKPRAQKGLPQLERASLHTPAEPTLLPYSPDHQSIPLVYCVNSDEALLAQAPFHWQQQWDCYIDREDLSVDTITPPQGRNWKQGSQKISKHTFSAAPHPS